MIIKFLQNGTGDPKLAASYLLGDKDHQGYVRAGVEIFRGDAVTFTALAESTKFRYCYTSAVIAWSPEDTVTDEQLNEVLDAFEEHAFAGLSLEQYHMTAVMHMDDDGSRHLHILVPRVELTSGKSLNIAPPGHIYYFDPLRDFFNHKYGWARPDDPARMKTTKLKNHHLMQNAAALKAGLNQVPKKTRVELINEYIQQRILSGVINSRDDVIRSLKEIGQVKAKNSTYLALICNDTTDRLKGGFYHAEFSFSAYRENSARQDGIKPALQCHQSGSIEYESKLQECLKRIQEVRRKRIEYNKNYYRAKAAQFDGDQSNASRISVQPRTTVEAGFIRETDSRYRVSLVSIQDGYAIPRPYEYVETATTVSKSTSDQHEQNIGISHSNAAGQRSTAKQQHQIAKRNNENDGVAEKNERQTQESGIRTSAIPGSDQEWNNVIGKTRTEIQKDTLVPWDIRHIQHPLPHHKFHLNVGNNNERYTAADLKKSIDHQSSENESRIGTISESLSRWGHNSETNQRSTEWLHRRTREVASASEQLSRDIEKRKLSIEQTIERQRQETESVSNGVEQGNFIHRVDRCLGKIREKISNCTKRLVAQFKAPTLDTGRGEEDSAALYNFIPKLGFNRLVKHARRLFSTRITQAHLDRLQEYERQAEQTLTIANQNIKFRKLSLFLLSLKMNNSELQLDQAMSPMKIAEKHFQQLIDQQIPYEHTERTMYDFGNSLRTSLLCLKGELYKTNRQDVEILRNLLQTVDHYAERLKTYDLLKPVPDTCLAIKESLNDLTRSFQNNLVIRESELTSIEQNPHHSFNSVFAPVKKQQEKNYGYENDL